MSDQMHSDLRSLEETLHCVVCFNHLRDPRMCSKCAKMICSSCLGKWMQTHRSCPHCAQPLRATDFLPCAFVTEIASIVERMAKTLECYDTCPDHGLQMLYFCKSCSLPLCSDCAMITPQHKNHEFDKLSNMYEYHVRMLKNEEQKMNLRSEDLKDILGNVEENLGRLKQAHESKTRQLAGMMEEMKGKLEANFKGKMVPLIGQQRLVSKEIDQMQELYEKVKDALAQKSKASVIVQAPTILSELQKVNIENLAQVDFSPQIFEFPSELFPPFESGAFVIENFSKYRDSSEVLYSDSLTFNGLNWRLKVYPNGNGFARGIYISLFLEMRSGLSGVSKYEYRVEMRSRRDPRTAIVREFTSDFESGECWGYNRFFRIDALEEEGYLDPEEDKILLKYYVRATSFPQHCKDQHRYIEHLETEKQRQIARLTELRSKLQNYESPAKALRLPSPPVVISAENPLEHVGDNVEVHSEDEPHAEESKHSVPSSDDLESMTRKLKLLSKLREQSQRPRADSSEKEESDNGSALWRQNQEYCSSGSDLSELDVSRPNTGSDIV